MTVEVFQRNDGTFCQSCFATKAWLTKLDVPFVERELTDDVAVEYRDQGFREQPIVVAFGKAHSGFKPQRLQEIAQDYRGREET